MDGRAAEGGNPRGMLSLAYQYKNGKGVETDFEKAMQWLDKTIDTCNRLLSISGYQAYGQGENHYERFDVDITNPSIRRNLENTIAEARKERDEVGVWVACERFRDMTRLGLQNSALEEVTRYAEAGKGRAQFELGVQYFIGNVILQDYAKAAAYYNKALAGGTAYAYEHLAELYAKGLGVAQDEDRAVELFNQAAMKGSKTADARISEIYQKRRGY